MPRAIPAHYIKGNAAARVPDRIICLDTESTRDAHDKGEDQEWELGVAAFIWWSSKGNCQTSQSRFDTPIDLWREITRFTRPKRRTVLYAHNVGYDVRISKAMTILPDLGWRLVDARIEDRSSWFKWQKDQANLILCDSMSIFDVSLNQLGQTLGMIKPPLPPATDREALFVRCETDVNILTSAILKYVAWLRTGECGNWQITGAGQSWAHWRHSHYTHKILVHDNEEALEAEVRAMWTGRCEAWRWGRDDHERVHEFDYSNAYPRIARDIYIPTRIRSVSRHTDIDKLLADSERYCILADVEVSAELPVVPTEQDGRIVWPVGTFQTVLWDPELRLLRDSGARVDVRTAWYYKREPALNQWGKWMIDQLHDDSGKVPQWKKIVLKNWSRTLIGRFGMKYKSWEKIAESPDSGVSVSDYKDFDTGETGKLMHLGHEILLQVGDHEGNDYCPQVTGYIMSVARAKLWRATRLANASEVLYMDTDSLLVTSTGRNNLQRRSGDTLLDGLTLKTSSHGYRIYGPRAIILDRTRKVAGLPKRSEEVRDHVFYGETWETVGHALASGNQDRVRIRYRRHTLVPNHSRRYLRYDGTTVPYQLPEGTPLSGPDVARTWDSLANEDGYPGILLGITPKELKQIPTALDRGLRYSVRAG